MRTKFVSGLLYFTERNEEQMEKETRDKRERAYRSLQLGSNRHHSYQIIGGLGL